MAGGRGWGTIRGVPTFTPSFQSFRSELARDQLGAAGDRPNGGGLPLVVSAATVLQVSPDPTPCG